PSVDILRGRRAADAPPPRAGGGVLPKELELEGFSGRNTRGPYLPEALGVVRVNRSGPTGAEEVFVLTVRVIDDPLVHVVDHAVGCRTPQHVGYGLGQQPEMTGAQVGLVFQAFDFLERRLHARFGLLALVDVGHHDIPPDDASAVVA